PRAPGAGTNGPAPAPGGRASSQPPMRGPKRRPAMVTRAMSPGTRTSLRRSVNSTNESGDDLVVGLVGQRAHLVPGERLDRVRDHHRVVVARPEGVCLRP